MGVTMPDTVAYASDESVNIMLHSALVMTGVAHPSTFNATYAKLPPSTTPWLQVPAGVLNRNFFAPNFYPSYLGIPQGVNPATVNGTAWGVPYVDFGIGKPLSVVIRGITFVYIVGGGVITEGDLLYCGDAYGRVDNAANLGIGAGTTAYALGRAQQTTTATANLIIPIDVNIVPVTS